MLFRKAYLSEAEWANDVADCEHHIMVLQSKLSENYEVQMMLELTAGQLSDAQKNWHDASSVDRQAFAHNLFEEIIYDLDTGCITSFKLKPWAESFLQLRVGIAEMCGENPANPTMVVFEAIFAYGLRLGSVRLTAGQRVRQSGVRCFR